MEAHTMKPKSVLRERLEAAVMERHCANHPLTEKWAAGKLSRNALMGWGIEQYHWISNIYRLKEEDIEHFWLHAVADTEHGGKGFDILDQYATTPELQDMAVNYARESARMRWFFFDGIYIHYEMGYNLR